MPNAAARRVARLRRAIARGEAAAKMFHAIRDELGRIRRATLSTEDKMKVDDMLQMNATALVTAERALAAAMADLALEQSRGH